MDLNLTIGIPAIGLALIANTVVNFLKFRNGDNGLKDSLKEVKNAQQVGFTTLRESNIKQEALLEQAVQELRTIVSKL